MAIEALSGLQPLPIPVPVQPAAAAATPAAGGAGVAQFPQLLFESVQGLNDAQVQAGQQVTGFLNGQGPDLHSVMIGTEQASLSLELAVQVRNKLIDAYNEIMRMQM